MTPTTSKPAVEQNDAHQGPPSGGARWTASKAIPVKVTYSDGSSWQASAKVTAGRTSADPLGSAEDHIKATTPGYGGWAADPTSDPYATDAVNYPKGQHSPLIKTRQERDYPHGDAPLQLNQAPCPNCRHQPTEIVKDKNSDGVWHCPSCGPLGHVDKAPFVNPYDPGFGFSPDRSIKLSGLFGKTGKKDTKLFRMVGSILEKNSGLSVDQSVHLALKAIRKFPEA